MDDTERQLIQSRVESLLFAYGEAMDEKRIAEALGISPEDCRVVLTGLEAEYRTHPERGLCLLRQDAKWQLGTKPENLETIEQMVKKDFEQDLSNASLETLSVVLYRGPIARAEIDAIRGVNSSFILRNLLLRGLVEREQDTKGHRVFLYKPSFALLKLLGITNRAELPDFETLSKKFEVLVSQATEQERQAADGIVEQSVSE